MFGTGTSTLLLELFMLINIVLAASIALIIQSWRRHVLLADKTSATIIALGLILVLLPHQLTAIGPALYAYDTFQFYIGLVVSLGIGCGILDATFNSRRR